MKVQEFRGSGVQGFKFALLVAAVTIGCSAPKEAQPAPTAKPSDSQHAGITTPHGDHSPHHGGLVLMNGETHYEVLLDRGGKHRIWFSNAVRDDLPASVASKVMMIVTRKGGPDETIGLQIDESGESWVASGQPVAGDDVMVKVTYVARGEPFEVEIPFMK